MYILCSSLSLDVFNNVIDYVFTRMVSPRLWLIQQPSSNGGVLHVKTITILSCETDGDNKVIVFRPATGPRPYTFITQETCKTEIHKPRLKLELEVRSSKDMESE